MKKEIIILAITVLGVLFFTNCDKETKERESRAYSSELYPHTTELNMTNSKVDIEARYPPNETPDSTKIHLSTQANPEGITVYGQPKESKYWDGNTHIEMRTTISVEIAKVNRKEYNQIIIDPDGDQLKISVDDGVYTKTYNVNTKPFPMITFWTFVDESNNEASLFLYDIQLDSTSTPTVKITSDSDPQGFELHPDYTDPLIYSWPKAFPNYISDFYFNSSGQSDAGNKTIGVKEGEKIYVEYNGKTYFITAFNECHWPMEEQ